MAEGTPPQQCHGVRVHLVGDLMKLTTHNDKYQEEKGLQRADTAYAVWNIKGYADAFKWQSTYFLRHTFRSSDDVTRQALSMAWRGDARGLVGCYSMTPPATKVETTIRVFIELVDKWNPSQIETSDATSHVSS
eukprot:m.285361 g.285361  ORF g.285361 m.285361 type:complete len:134 (+) comp17774_c0_seq3:475-876(+)